MPKVQLHVQAHSGPPFRENFGGHGEKTIDYSAMESRLQAPAAA